VHALRYAAAIVSQLEPVPDMNPFNHEHTIFSLLHLAAHFPNQATILGINLARLQRASKCAYESTRNCGNQIIDRGSMSPAGAIRVDAIMGGNGPVDTKHYRLRLAWDIGVTDRAT
jgi:hypothetical protein